MKVGLIPGHVVLNGDPAPPEKGHSTPNFSAHVCCGQTAGWIKMPLGMEVFLGTVSVVATQSPISATAEHLLKKKTDHGFNFLMNR